MKYFAFGSNMDEERMRKRNMTINGMKSGKLQNYNLVFNKISINGNGEGNANIIKAKGFVEGIVYETDEESLRKMDIKEGVKTGHYKREKVIVKTKDGMEECVTYISEMISDGLKPKKEYLAHLLKGEMFLSQQYYKKLKKVETLD